MPAPITLFSANVKLLPKGIGGSKADDRRAGAIANWLLERRPDVVCLQEVFSEDGRGVLKKKLGKHYKHMVAKSSDKDFLEEDSGLFLASRFEIGNHRFVEYDAAAGTDQLSDKGLLGTILKLPERRNLLLFNTHMQSSEAYAEVRRRQLRQARRFMVSSFRNKLSKVKAMPNVAMLLVGDLNVIGERAVGSELLPTAEYARALSLLGHPRDLFRETHKPKAPGYTWDGPSNKLAGDKDRQRLDYVLAFDEVPQPDDNAATLELGKVRDVKVQVVDKLPNGAFYSDHYGLMTTFSVA